MGRLEKVYLKNNVMGLLSSVSLTETVILLYCVVEIFCLYQLWKRQDLLVCVRNN